MGRAKDPGEFVKHGCTEATIEIELARSPSRQRRNQVICRTIKREGNKSLFSVNGVSASRGQVLKLAQSFSIQIDNLCQFLPQDKVSEFAALTPVDLLSSTQRAAAGADMIKFHDDLKKLRTEQKRLQLDNKGDREMLANLENRQELQRADVERMRQQEEVKMKIERLEKARPIVDFKGELQRAKDAKKKMSEIEREYNELQVALAPAMDQVKAKGEYVHKMDEACKEQKRVVEHADSTAARLGKGIEDHEDTMKSLSSEIQAEKKSVASHRQEASKTEMTIKKLKHQLHEEPVEFDINYYNDKIVSIIHIYNGGLHMLTHNRENNDDGSERLRTNCVRSTRESNLLMRRKIK